MKSSTNLINTTLVPETHRAGDQICSGWFNLEDENQATFVSYNNRNDFINWAYLGFSLNKFLFIKFITREYKPKCDQSNIFNKIYTWFSPSPFPSRRKKNCSAFHFLIFIKNHGNGKLNNKNYDGRSQQT